jgi:hypothetical protein
MISQYFQDPPLQGFLRILAKVILRRILQGINKELIILICNHHKKNLGWCTALQDVSQFTKIVAAWFHFYIKIF